MALSKAQTRDILFHTHAYIGIGVTVLFYIALFFGTLSMVAPYIALWEKPSRHLSAPAHYDIDALVTPLLTENAWPEYGVRITLPSHKDPLLSLGHRLMDAIHVNPYSGAVVKDEGSALRDLVVDLHLGRVLGRPGVFLMGVACVGALFLILNGWWLSFKRNSSRAPLLKLRPKRQEHIHRLFSQILSPLMLILALTSAYFGVMFTIGGGLAYGITKGEATMIQRVLGPVVFPKVAPLPKSDTPSSMQSLNSLLEKARENHPHITIQTLTLERWGFEDAKVTFSGPLTQKPYLTERINHLSISFKGSDGTLVHKQEIEEVHWIKKALSVFYFLHFISDTEAFFRLFLFVLGVGLCVSVIAGAWVFVHKRLNNPNTQGAAYLWSLLFIGTFLGSLIATAVAFLAQWLLPFGMEERSTWTEGLFYLSWLATFAYASHTRHYRTSLWQLSCLSGVLLCAVPLIHGIQSGYFLPQALGSGLIGIALVDGLMGALGLAMLFFGLTLRRKIS